jgi:hypothetical protein
VNVSVNRFVGYVAGGSSDERSRPVKVLAVRVMNDSRDKLLAGLSENSARVYELVFDAFWSWASARYSPSRGVDPLVWLAAHRRDETKPGASDSMHCERIVDKWYRSLSSTDLAESSAVRYRAVVAALFGRFSRVPLRLPLELSDGVS